MTENTSVSLASTAGLAVVIGSSGGLGAALMLQLTLRADSYPQVVGISRQGEIRLDYKDEGSVAAAAQQVAGVMQQTALPLRLLLVATGFLQGEQGQPERSWSHLNPGYLQHCFQINTLGPALVMKHFLPMLPKTGRCVAGFVSAKVGSIGDNALGGWYGYRAAKAALNQLVKTASIELARRNPQGICVALHPGTVATALSKPFAKTGLQVRPAEEAACDLLRVIHTLTPADTGALIDYHGKTLPF